MTRKNRLTKTSSNESHHNKMTEKHSKSKVKLAKQRWKDAVAKIREISSKGTKRIKDLNVKLKQDIKTAETKAKQLQKVFENLEKKYANKPNKTSKAVRSPIKIASKQTAMRSAKKHGRKAKAKDLQLAHDQQLQASQQKSPTTPQSKTSRKSRNSDKLFAETSIKKRLMEPTSLHKNPALEDNTIINNQNIPSKGKTKSPAISAKAVPLQPTTKLINKIKTNQTTDLLEPECLDTNDEAELAKQQNKETST